MEKRLYFDYAASAPLDPRVRTAMDEVAALVGNPSSIHEEGRILRACVDRARAQVARLFDAAPEEIVFTSGATESNVLAVVGLFKAARAAAPGRALRILASPIEHSSVEETLRVLEDEYGAVIDRLQVGGDGAVLIDRAAASLRDDTAIVCMMWANNVLGTLQPVAGMARLVQAEQARRGTSGMPIRFVCDAVQAVGTVDVGAARAGIDIVTFSGHKICGPKGVGGCVVRRGVEIRPLFGGGGQEHGSRHGTENVSAIVGLGRAAEILHAERTRESERMTGLREALLRGLAASAPSLRLVGDPLRSVPGIAYFRAPREKGDVLALKLDAAGVAVSSGSACDSGRRRPSRVLRAVVDEQSAVRGGFRVSFGRFTTEHDVRALVAKVKGAI